MKQKKRGELVVLMMLMLVSSLFIFPLSYAVTNPIEQQRSSANIRQEPASFTKILPLESEIPEQKNMPNNTNLILPILLTLVFTLAISRPISSKKGQITVFVIIGIILVFSSALIFYIRTKVTESNLQSEITITEKIPLALQPIRKYVESCIQDEAKHAIKALGERGGYMSSDGFIINPLYPTQSEAIEMYPGSGYFIPYWLHNERDDSCVTSESCYITKDLMPPLCKTGSGCTFDGEGSFEEKAEDLIEENVARCLLGFSSFEDQGYIITIDEEPEVEMNIKQVTSPIDLPLISVFMKMPITIKREGQSSRITEYRVEFESGIFPLYQMAKELIETEYTECMFEKHTINSLSYFMGLESGKLPPIYDHTIGESSPRTWILPNVETDIVRYTERFIRMMGFYGTRNFDWPNVENDQYVELRQSIADKNVFFPFSGLYDASMHVQYFNWWKPYLQIYPNDGGLIKPDTTNLNVGGFISVFTNAFNPIKYEFRYQYSYPVLVQLKKIMDDGTEYMLRFAIEVNIRNNNCMTENLELTFSQPPTESYMCDDFMIDNGKNISVTVKDKRDNQLLEGAKISYSAQSICELGKTDENGTINTMMPDIFGGFLFIEKDGYVSHRIHYYDISNTITAELKPIVPINFTIKTINPQLYDAMLQANTLQQGLALRRTQAQPLYLNDSVIGTFSLIPIDYREEEFSGFYSYDNGTFAPQTIDVVPGNYHMETILFKKDFNVTIPDEYDRICVDKSGDGLDCKKKPVSPTCGPDRGSSDAAWLNSDCYIQGYKCECEEPWYLPGGCTSNPSDYCEAFEEIKYDEVPMTSFPNGGAMLNADTAPFTISGYSQIDGASELVFYIFRENIPERHHHLEDMNAFNVKSTDHVWMIKPELI